MTWGLMNNGWGVLEQWSL